MTGIAQVDTRGLSLDLNLNGVEMLGSGSGYWPVYLQQWTGLSEFLTFFSLSFCIVYVYGFIFKRSVDFF